MIFDTTKSDAIIGIFLLGMSLSLSIALVVLSNFGGYDIILAQNIVLIIDAICFGTGAVLIFMNSNKAKDLTVDPSTSNLVRYIFLGCLFILVLGFLLIQL